jgi:ABC-type glycerol-3-phosphate transport system substrate-binding protein
VSDLAIGDREYRDVPVGVRGPSRNAVDDDVFGQQVKEVLTIRKTVEALLDDAEERVERRPR